MAEDVSQNYRDASKADFDAYMTELRKSRGPVVTGGLTANDGSKELNEGLTDIYNIIQEYRSTQAYKDSKLGQKEQEFIDQREERRVERKEDRQQKREENKANKAQEKSEKLLEKIKNETDPDKKEKLREKHRQLAESMGVDTRSNISIPNKMKSPMKRAYKANVEAFYKIGRGMVGQPENIGFQALDAGLDIISLIRKRNRDAVEKELQNFNIDDVQNGFNDFKNGQLSCTNWATQKKKELAELRRQARRVNPNSEKFQELKMQMSQLDATSKRLNGAMELLQDAKAEWADMHGMGDKEDDGRFRYSKATRESESYHNLNEIMTKQAGMEIDENGQIVFHVMRKDGSGIFKTTLDQALEGVYEIDEAGQENFDALRDQVIKDQRNNLFFDQGKYRANLNQIFGEGEDVNKKVLMSWMYDFPEFSSNGKSFINNYTNDGLESAKVQWATDTINQYKGSGGLKDEVYNDLMGDGKITPEEADEFLETYKRFRVPGSEEPMVDDNYLIENYMPLNKYFDPDNSFDWGQKLSGEDITIGQKIRDELITYYMDQLMDLHDQYVNAENRGNGKDTYTTNSPNYDPNLDPNN